MAQKVLAWSNSQLNIVYAVFMSHVYQFILYMYSNKNSLQLSNICVDLHMILFYMLKMAYFNRIRGWFYYVFKKQEAKKMQ